MESSEHVENVEKAMENKSSELPFEAERTFQNECW